MNTAGALPLIPLRFPRTGNSVLTARQAVCDILCAAVENNSGLRSRLLHASSEEVELTATLVGPFENRDSSTGKWIGAYRYCIIQSVLQWTGHLHNMCTTPLSILHCMMKLGGFALKKGKKKAALGASAGFSSTAPAALQAPEKIFVTDFDPNAPAALTEDGEKPLVIPLLETNAWHADPNVQKENKMGTSIGEMGTLSDTSADEQAAAQILAETQTAKSLSGPNAQLKRDLVIPFTDEREKKRAELFQDGAKRPQTEQKKPILQQNAVPDLERLQDVADKYRHDVALRPEAPDVLSDVYEAVPVEAFGAALLRGMGWTGHEDQDDVGVAPQPRHKLLGLGATKRPTLAAEDKKKRKKKRTGTEKTQQQDNEESKQTDRRSGLNADRREDKQRRSSRRSVDRERRRSSRSPSRSRSDRRKRSRSRSQSRRNRGCDRDRDGRDRYQHRARRSRSHRRSRSDRRR